MSGIELLREAARLMRERAESATYQPGRWAVDVAGPLASTAWLGPSHDVLTATWPQAAHVDAFASPAVALAVADWLDGHHADLASAGGEPLQTDSPGDLEHAMAVARAYLGGEPR